MTDAFAGLPRGHYGAILADPPWQFDSLWGGRPKKVGGNYPSRAVDAHYDTLTTDQIAALPVSELAAEDCVVFMWTCWPVMDKAFAVLQGWEFKYKTCAFSWMKADPYRLFADDKTPTAGMGYWTRANTEPCLLATRGKPKRLNADVRQGIIAPRREHSRKPDGIHERIERLVAGPYLELFARQKRPGWDVWGNQTDKFAPVPDPMLIFPPSKEGVKAEADPYADGWPDAEANSRGCYDVAIEAMRGKKKCP